MSDASPRPDGDRWLRDALEIARQGGLLAYPTETSWGLGAAAHDAAAIRRLRAFKGERGAKPFSVLVGDRSRLPALGFTPNAAAASLMTRFWPGPLTLVLPCSAPWAAHVGAPDGAVAVRCSSHPVARALATATEEIAIGPLTATSLNRSGEPPARRWVEAERCCATGECTLASPAGIDAGAAADSSIVDCCGEQPKLLREGAVLRSDLAEWITPA